MKKLQASSLFSVISKWCKKNLQKEFFSFCTGCSDESNTIADYDGEDLAGYYAF